MGRITGSQTSRRHRITREREDEYTLWWRTERRIRNGGRHLRAETVHCRDTNRAGAERFAKKWGVAMPAEPES